MTTPSTGWVATVRERLRLPADDLLRGVAYRRLFTSILISSFGGQITLLALPLTAALLLHATPLQMGFLSAMEIAPFVLFSLPAGVWLDRVRKLPVYVGGELLLGCVVLSVPIAWHFGWLSMGWMYAVGFITGTVYTTAGSAAQIVLMQVVPRERLVEAHAKNSLASSSSEIVGPGVAGVLIKLVGAPMTLLVDALMLLLSASILRGIRIDEPPPPPSDRQFWRDLKAGLGFVRGQPLLVALALTVSGWQFCHNTALVVWILHGSRGLGLSEQALGFYFALLGLATVATALVGARLSARWGCGPTFVIGFALCSMGWLAPGLISNGAWGVAAFAFMLICYGVGATLQFINFLPLRQAVTPEPMLGRMTSTMRWLILIPAGPGALFGGWLGEHMGLPSALWVAGLVGLVLSALAWRNPVLQGTRELPKAAVLDH